MTGIVAHTYPEWWLKLAGQVAHWSTDYSRKELHKWVASGRSPYDNGDYIYGENGWPMDFVSAMRFEADQMEWFASLSEEEKQALQGKSQQYDTELDEPISMFAGIFEEGDVYLPF